MCLPTSRAFADDLFYTQCEFCITIKKQEWRAMYYLTRDLADGKGQQSNNLHIVFVIVEDFGILMG